MNESRGGDITGVCSMCSYPGAVQLLRTSLDEGETGMYFPSLISSGEKDSRSQNSVQACLLCADLMREQWKMQENRLIPVAKRKYWTKAWSPEVNCPEDYNPPSSIGTKKELDDVSSSSISGPSNEKHNSSSDLNPISNTGTGSGSSPTQTTPAELLAACLKNPNDPSSAALAMLLMKQNGLLSDDSRSNAQNSEQLIRWIQHLTSSSGQ